MIAFYQETEETTSTPSMRRARRMVASALLEQESLPQSSAPRVAAWKAWLFAVWVVVVTACYFAHMFGVASSIFTWQ